MSTHPKARQISRHLELAAAKCQAAQLLARLRMVRDNLDPFFPPLRHPPAPGGPLLLLRPQPDPCDESLPPPIGSKNQDAQLEGLKSVDQNESLALALVHAHPQLFASQGAVVATHRKVGQRTYGPYYRLAYRTEGQQRSVYIGRNPQQADAVRTALSTLQTPWRATARIGPVRARCSPLPAIGKTPGPAEPPPGRTTVSTGPRFAAGRGNIVFKTTAWRSLRRPPSLSPDTAPARFIEIDPAGSRNRPGHETTNETIHEVGSPPSSRLGMKPRPVLTYAISDATYASCQSNRRSLTIRTAFHSPTTSPCSTSFTTSGGQLTRSGYTPDTPRVTFMIVGGTWKIPHE